MVDTRKILAQLFLVCSVLLIIGFEISTVRGARVGGGRFGGSRYSSYRSSSYRSSSYRSSSYRSYRSSSYRSSRYTRNLGWKVALATSLYYGSRRYSTRSRYRSNSEPQICENYVNFQEGVNKTQKWGKFVCPLGELPDDYAYCCGDAGRQTCCRFFDDGGRTAGVVIGILILFGIIGLIIFCICRSQKRKKKAMKKAAKASSSCHYTPCSSNQRPGYNKEAHFDSNRAPMTDNRSIPLDNRGNAGYPTMGGTAYPVSPAYPPGGMAPGYPSSGMDLGYPAMPPSYEKANDLPYSPNPTGYQAPYQGPYPMAPDPTAPYNPQHPAGASAPPYSPAPIGFTAAPGQPNPPQGYAYNDPNMPGQGYTAPNAVPPPYPN